MIFVKIKNQVSGVLKNALRSCLPVGMKLLSPIRKICQKCIIDVLFKFNFIKQRLLSLSPLKRLYHEYISKYRLYIIVSFVLMIVVAATTSAIAYVIGPTINDVFVQKSQKSLYFACLTLVVLYIIKTVSSYFQDYSLKALCTRIQTDMRVNVFNKMIRMPMKDFEATPSGQVTTMFFTDIMVVGNSAQELFVTAVRDLFTVFCLTCVVFYNDWILASVAICVYPLVFVPLAKASRSARNKYVQGQNDLQILAGKIADITNGIKTIKTYNTEEIETRRAKKTLINFTRVMLEFSKKLALASPAMELACGLSLALIIFIGGLRVIYGYSSVGSFFSFFGALIMVHRPARSLAGMNIKMNMCAGSLDRVFSFIDKLKTENLREGIEPDLNNAVIKFDNVNFDYVKSVNGETENTTLRNINFEIQPNTKVAFVGLSGSGKSTIMNLLTRLYKYDTGIISINGVNINDISLSYLRSKIAYVGQDNFLFDDTVRSNILYGSNDNITQENIENTMKKAQIDFLGDYASGLNEMVGFNGGRFSTGQKQRIAIARALIKDAPIIIFDEATSALDAQTEHAIRDSVFENLDGKSVIIVAHRLSSIVNCDKIYVMQEGKIIEEGTHKQLLELDGLYKHLWNSLNDDSEAK